METKNIRYLGLACSFSFLIALYIFGYAITYNETDFVSLQRDNDGNEIKDYSISFSLANGNHIGLASFFSIGLIIFLYQLYLKFYKKDINTIYYILNVLVILLYSLVISMIFYSPYTDRAKNFNENIKEEHYAVAVVAFTSNLIFNIMVAYLLFYIQNKYLYFYLLVFTLVAFYVTLIGDAAYGTYIKDKEPHKTYKDTYFPIAENINFLFLILSMLLISFLPYIEKKNIITTNKNDSGEVQRSDNN